MIFGLKGSIVVKTEEADFDVSRHGEVEFVVGVITLDGDAIKSVPVQLVIIS